MVSRSHPQGETSFLRLQTGTERERDDPEEALESWHRRTVRTTQTADG